MLAPISNDALARAVASPEWLQLYDQRDRRRSTTRAPRATRGARASIRSSPRRRSPTSPPSSRCTSRCRSTPAASACWPAITARKPATSACRSSASGSCIRRATSTRSITPDGWQEERYERLNWEDAPIEPALTPDGKPCVTAVPLGDRTVLAAVWRVRAGRVSLFLLDTDLPENAPRDRELSARLYGGDRETRLQQEIVLGIGGVRALRALGFAPALYHLNEGHAAFVVLQRIRDLCEQGADLRRGAGRRAPHHRVHHAHAGAGRPRRVPVRHGRNAPRPGCGAISATNRARFLDLGSHDNGAGPMFNMTALAMRTAGLGQRREPAARRSDQADVAVAVAGHARAAACR